ncbi:MAG TPA: endonuclease/exonuclease/phosphatase family protein [Solirubrobacteraceae bacterium]|nr:endonuclease/exonuclease/phosphatase family protein [Solirubrobacteraceae bacterium]
MRLITWNVNRRVSLLSAQAAALATRSPDVVALQEVTPRSWPLWRDALAAAGMQHAVCSLDGADPARTPATRRRTGVVLASREPLETAEPLAVPWPETTLAARVGEVTVHTAHVPNAANGWTKPHTLAALRAGLAVTSGPRVLCGDFNTPRRESPDGSVISFARDSRGRLRPERGEPWDAAELGIVPGLRALGFADAFRTVHGYADRSPSWVWSHGGGWRLDHIFASDLRVESAAYHHAWRDDGLSDHSPLEADLGADQRPRAAAAAAATLGR